MVANVMASVLVLAGGSGSGDATSIWDDMLQLDLHASEKVLRTIAVYLGIVILIRLAGKRLMAQMNSLDLVVVLLLSNVVQNAIIGDDNSLTGGLLGALVLVVTNAALERLTQRFAAIRRLLEGTPTVVVDNGLIDQAAVTRLGMTQLELREALRTQGADSADEVARAEIEPGGIVVVDLKRGEQAASRDELLQAVAELKRYIDATRRPART